MVGAKYFLKISKNMNRLIIIGNGFDLARGLQSSYPNFILWYLKKCLAIDNRLNESSLFNLKILMSRLLIP